MNQQSTVRLVIGVLGLLALSVVIGGIYLTSQDKSLPGELIAIGSAAAGAVGGILSRTSGDDPQEVVGPRGGPVHVTDEAGQVDRSFVTMVACVAVAVVVVLWAFGVDFPIN